MITTGEIFSNSITLPSSKWTAYFEVYDRYFSKFQNTSVIFMEVGIQFGGSVQMWREFFGKDAIIYGVDVEPNTLNIQIPANNIFIGDQGDPNFWDATLLNIPHIDCFLDDGGHSMTQQITTLKKVWPKISHGGVYICEDLHTSYWDQYGGGLRKPTTMVEFLKNLIDVINEEWIDSKSAVDNRISDIEAVHFYNGMCIIIKGKKDNKPIWNCQ